MQQLTRGNIVSELLKMAIPISIGIFLSMLFFAVDTFYISTLGQNQLTAITFTFPVILAFTHLAMGFGTGVTTHIAQMVGSHKVQKAKRSAGDAIILAIVASIILMMTSLFFMESLFELLGAHAEHLPFIYDYMVPWSYSIPFFTIMLITNHVIRGYGDTKTPAKILMTVTLLNLILDPFFIFGSYGLLPRMEVQGAALATLIASAIGMCMSLAILILRAKVQISLRLRTFWHWQAMAYVGLPSMISQLLPPVAQSIIVLQLAASDTQAVAAYGIASRVEAVLLVFFMGLAVAMNIFVAQNVAAKRKDRVIKAMHFARVSVLIVALLGVFIVSVFGYDIVGWFSEDAQVMHYGLLYFAFVPISYAAIGYVMVLNAGYNGRRMPFSALTFNLLRHVGLLMLCIVLFKPLFGTSGVILAIPVSHIVTAIISHYWFFYTPHRWESRR